MRAMSGMGRQPADGLSRKGVRLVRAGSGVWAGYRRSTAEGEENLLTTSFAFLSIAVALGAMLLAGLARRAALVHGLCGLAGAIAACLAAFHGRLHGSLGGAVLGLLLAALCGGLFVWGGWRSGLVVFLHAMAGGVAYLLLTGAVFS